MKKFSIKTALTLVATGLALIASVWAIDEHYVPREVYNLYSANVSDQFKQINKSRAVDNAYRDVQFWTQQEASIRVQLAHCPAGNPLYQELIRQLNEATRQKNEALRVLNQLRSN